MVVDTRVPVAETSFDQACESFKEFLAREGLSSNLLWVFREDVIFNGDNIFIKVPVSPENDRLAENCYDLGRQRNFGINLHAFCLLQSRPCCYVALPEDDLDAQHMLMSNVAVKYSVVSDPRQAQPVTSDVASSDLGVAGFNTHIPSKHTLLPVYPVVNAG